MTFAIFHDFPGLENGLPKFHDFPWPGGTLSVCILTVTYLTLSLSVLTAIFQMDLGQSEQRWIQKDNSTRICV